jgi:succinoglycan biosynthesis protein ExoA
VKNDESGSAPSLSIIVPCRNEVRHIDRFLGNVLEQQLPVATEILVADGMSDDGTRERLREWVARDPRIVLVDNPERTTAHALNHAIRRSTAPVLLRMDVHTEFAPDYVARCLETLAATGADNVGGPARTRSTGLFQQANALAYRSFFSVGGARFHDPDYRGPVDTVVYGCWRRDVFERFGGFDTELVRNQDDEHNLRISRSGGRLWQEPAIRSWYFPRSTPLALFNQYRQYGYWKVRVIQKHRLPASWRHLVPAAFVAALATLLALAPFGLAARILLAALLTAYLLSSLAASAVASARDGHWSCLPWLPVAFACYHVGYGVGFLQGIWDFVVSRRKRSAAAFERLTR